MCVFVLKRNYFSQFFIIWTKEEEEAIFARDFVKKLFLRINLVVKQNIAVFKNSQIHAANKLDTEENRR